MSTLVLHLDDRLKRQLDSLAARNRKPLPDWAAEQLGRLATQANEIPAATYSAEWMATFGSVENSSFVAPASPLPAPVAPRDAES